MLREIARRIKQFYQHPRLITRIFRISILLVGAAVIFASAFVLMVWIGVFGKLPDTQDLKNIQHPLASEVYSADSVLLGRYFLQNRSPVSSDEIPQSLKDALVATEDVRFYEHGGIDVKSLFRVLVKSILLQDESSGGGSTLTQQLAKNLYPRKSYAMLSLPINKIREFLTAIKIESIYSKDDILVLYLNTVPLADNTYGIKTAADRFFSVKVSDLTVDQSAVLVGMLKATHSYNPRLFPERSLNRRNVVIGQLTRYGYLKEEEGKRLMEKPLGLHYNNTNYNAGVAPYFRSYIQRELLQWCKENKKADGSAYNLYTDGLKIYTTIDSRMQRYAEQAMQKQMKTIQQRFESQLDKNRLDKIAKSKLTSLPQYKSLKEAGLNDNEINSRLKQPVKTKVFSWEGEKEVEMSVYDSLKHHLKFLQAGVLAVDPVSAEVKVWVGGIDHKYFQYDHVRESTKRQVGSTLKPLLYAAALERGISPCAYIPARQTSYTNMDDWTPQNTDEETYERKYSMEGGLSGSVNTVSVKLLEKTGIHTAISLVRRMGITSELPAVPSLALGTPSVSMMEMVTAYMVLANDGVYKRPHYLVAVADRNGKVIERFDTKDKEQTQALSKASAQMMVHMLRSVVSEGTGSALRYRFGLTNDIAGKTGTTQSNVDGWFIGVMPRLVVGSWVGADDPRMHFKSTALGQGAATALPIVGEFLVRANKDKSLNDILMTRFKPLPEELVDKMDCKQSKSDKNLFERIFRKNKKKGVKVTKFKNRKEKNSSP